MHLQVKAKVKSGSGMSIEGDDGEDVAVSATYRAGALAEMLTILRDAGFNLRTASGNQVELGGEFWFWVDERPSDADHEIAAIAARDLLRGHEYEADTFEVHAKHLSDSKGTLLDFVNEVTKGKLLVENICVGTPDDEGIPVQIFTAQVRRNAAKG
jgi:hypothetical protein